MNTLQSFLKSKKGQGLVEYALILALILVVVIAALSTVGEQSSTAFSQIGSAVAQYGF